MKRYIIPVLCFFSAALFIARCADTDRSFRMSDDAKKLNVELLSPKDFVGISGSGLGSLATLTVTVTKVFDDKFYVRMISGKSDVRCVIYPQSESPPMPSAGDILKITFFEQIEQRGADEDVYIYLHSRALQKKHDPPGGDGVLRYGSQFNVLDYKKLSGTNENSQN